LISGKLECMTHGTTVSRVERYSTIKLAPDYHVRHLALLLPAITFSTPPISTLIYEERSRLYDPSVHGTRL